MAYWVEGTVSRLYPNSQGCYIRLSGIAASATPRYGYFNLKLTHANYDALYSLILAAAINGYKLGIRTNSTITSRSYAEVSYVTVNW